jgi:hypothetical protein
LSPGLPSGPRATLSTARPTPTAAANPSRVSRPTFRAAFHNPVQHRPALPQGGVLRFFAPTREAPCSKSC